ncbi:MAG: Zn-ribbon containing protein [Candidatus Altiarchaeota archaeon]
MPHKCARCGEIYDDGAPELIQGCKCGARVFLYIRVGENESKEEVIAKLKGKEISISDLEWLDKEFGDKLQAEGKTIHLDVETLERIDEGKFKLDVASLMRGKPVVIKAKEGVYYIDIPYAFKKKKK